MAKIRTGRVAEQIKQQLSHVLQTEMKDPKVGFVTVTGVEVTNDLSQARVYLSVLGDDEQKEETLDSLVRAAGFLRTELGRRIRLRHIPELLFRLDTSIDYGNRIETILKKLEDGEDPQ